MPNPSLVAGHYTSGNLLAAIEAAVVAQGKTISSVTVDDLGPADEFHVGGRIASESFLDQLNITKSDHLLDVGCGLGGTSRFVAKHYGCRVTGIDLTGEFIETGKALCRWVGLDDRVDLQQGSATALPYADAMFDKAYMMHVGMNIEDKAALASNVYRVLKAGGTFGIYDVMQTGDGPLCFPVPWATTSNGSAVDSPARYRQVLEEAGFEIITENSRAEFALEFFAQMAKQNAAPGGPPPLGLHLVMGEDRPLKMKNMVENISAGRLAPTEIIARKP
ncbi:MAG: ubiquinone/menaquinone biosynthesis C-methylase UbiE [Gammaproteobacteria bacterium]|jgi:ubiquinone/menaquinone biosynthesis C-methylase UbiE